MSGRLRIALASQWKLDDPRAWSGTIVPMRWALERRTHIVPIQVSSKSHPVERALGRASLRSRKGLYRATLGPLSARRSSRALWRQVRPLWRSGEIDVVVVLSSGSAVSRLPDGPPVVQVTDATFRALVDFYPDHRGLHPLTVRQGEAMMRRSLTRTAAVVVNNEWAMEALVREGYQREQVVLAPFGPVVASDGEQREAATGSSLRVLVVARDWARKGGDAAVAAVGRLRAAGAPASLTVVGAAPDGLPDWVTATGPVEPAALSAIYNRHDVLLELAVANAGGTTLTDAAAHGLVSVATDVGGVPTIVRNGLTGVLVPNGDRLVEHATDALRRLQDPFLRSQMSAAALRHQRTTMTWEGWARAVEAVCQAVVERRATTTN